MRIQCGYSEEEEEVEEEKKEEEEEGQRGKCLKRRNKTG